MIYLRDFFITFVVFMGIDLVWLGIVAKKLYKSKLGFIMASSPNWIVAIIFYIIFIIGLMYFALYPSLESKSLIGAVLVGMIFGFITYATYDLTNLATLKDWPISITIIDMIWGTSLGGLTTGISYFIIKLIGH